MFLNLKVLRINGEPLPKYSASQKVVMESMRRQEDSEAASRNPKSLLSNF